MARSAQAPLQSVVCAGQEITHFAVKAAFATFANKAAASTMVGVGFEIDTRPVAIGRRAMGQPNTQAPLAQYSLGAQRRLHAPQCAGFVCRNRCTIRRSWWACVGDTRSRNRLPHNDNHRGRSDHKSRNAWGYRKRHSSLGRKRWVCLEGNRLRSVRLRIGSLRGRHYRKHRNGCCYFADRRTNAHTVSAYHRDNRGHTNLFRTFLPTSSDAHNRRSVGDQARYRYKNHHILCAEKNRAEVRNVR